MEQQFLDVELSAGEGVFASRRGLPRRPRRRHSLQRAVLWAAATMALLAGLGYVLMVRHVDPGSARSAIMAELANVPMFPGERIETRVAVYRRSPWDYFRSTHGVLAATSYRLLLLTVPPADRFSGEVERAVVERRDFPKDTLTRLNRALDHPPFNFVFHTAPVAEGQADYYHWHIEIMPKLTRVAGFEIGSGFYINPTPPEDAAQYLRELARET